MDIQSKEALQSSYGIVKKVVCLYIDKHSKNSCAMSVEFDKTNDGVGFIDSSHEYVNLTDGRKYKSVTTLIEELGQPFDEFFWGTYKAIETIEGRDRFRNIKQELLKTKDEKAIKRAIKRFNLDQDAIIRERKKVIAEWDETNREACERGTKIHKGFEDAVINRKKDISLQRYGIGGKFDYHNEDNAILKNEICVLPEYLIHNDYYGVAGQIDLLARDRDKIYIIDYKGLDITTPIPTDNGYVLMKDIKEGDRVYDEDGNKCKVLHKSETHYNDCYKITFNTGEDIIADKDHRWSIYKNNKNIVLTTEEIYDHYIKNRENCNDKEEIKIKACKSIFKPGKEYAIEPYVVGMIIGYSETGKFTKEMRARLHSFGYTESSIKEHYETLMEQDDNGKKHLDINKLEEYTEGSIAQRTFLFQGLLHSGVFTTEDECTLLLSKNKRLVWFLIKILTSLGVLVYKCKRKGKYCIYWFSNAVRLIDTTEECDCDISNSRTILNVEKTATVPTQCIEVDSPKHTYLFGYSHIVTHNTNKRIEEKSYYSPKTRRYEMMKAPLDNVMDCNYYHYTLQLSTYAYLISLMNPDFKVAKLVLHHVNHQGEQKLYELEYLKDEVIKMLEWHRAGGEKANHKNIDF